MVVAWASFLQTAAHGGHRALLVALTTVWGLRLAGYLFWRWRKNGPDSRYVFMLKRVDNPAMFMLTRVFVLQAILLLFVSLPF